MTPELIASLVRYWMLEDWNSYTETLNDITEDQLRNASKMLHLMAASMEQVHEMRKQDIDQEG